MSFVQLIERFDCTYLVLWKDGAEINDDILDRFVVDGDIGENGNILPLAEMWVEARASRDRRVWRDLRQQLLDVRQTHGWNGRRPEDVQIWYQYKVVEGKHNDEPGAGNPLQLRQRDTPG